VLTKDTYILQLDLISFHPSNMSFNIGI